MTATEQIVLQYEKPIYRLAYRLTRDHDAALRLTVQVFVHLSGYLAAQPQAEITLRQLYQLTFDLLHPDMQEDVS